MLRHAKHFMYSLTYILWPIWISQFWLSIPVKLKSAWLSFAIMYHGIFCDANGKKKNQHMWIMIIHRHFYCTSLQSTSIYIVSFHFLNSWYREGPWTWPFSPLSTLVFIQLMECYTSQAKDSLLYEPVSICTRVWCFSLHMTNTSCILLNLSSFLARVDSQLYNVTSLRIRIAILFTFGFQQPAWCMASYICSGNPWSIHLFIQRIFVKWTKSSNYHSRCWRCNSAQNR